jgi:hypothetical protein
MKQLGQLYNIILELNLCNAKTKEDERDVFIFVMYVYLVVLCRGTIRL